MTQTLRKIPVARPVLGEREVEAVRRVILSGWVTQGPEVEAFEREFAETVGARHACAVSNFTTALHLALRAGGVGPRVEVITVSHSGHRGCSLCERQRESLERALGEDRQAAWAHRLLFFPPAQGDDDGRRRDADHVCC